MAALPSSWPVGATVSFIAVSVALRKRDDSGDTLNSFFFFYSLHLEAQGEWSNSRSAFSSQCALGDLQTAAEWTPFRYISGFLSPACPLGGFCWVCMPFFKALSCRSVIVTLIPTRELPTTVSWLYRGLCDNCLGGTGLLVHFSWFQRWFYPCLTFRGSLPPTLCFYCLFGFVAFQ